MERLEKRRYRVNLEISGNVERIVLATSEEDAVVQVKKLLLQGDGMTPQPSAIPAFCWDVGRVHPSIHFRDMTDEEAEAFNNERNMSLAMLAVEARKKMEADEVTA